MVKRGGEEEILFGGGLRLLGERGRRVADLLAGLLPIAHGGQVVAHELLYERPRLGKLLLSRHRQEGEAEEEGEEGEEGFHFRSWSSELESGIDIFFY